MTALLVTGTGTGVGKTVVTAAIAALAVARGEQVVVVKPAQTGEPDGAPGDAAEVARLAGDVRTVELVRYPDPLSPEAAARLSGRPPLTLDGCVAAIGALDADLVLVEGAGGLLVRYDDAGLTMADVAAALALPVVLVTEAALGTLNATALTLEAMERRGLALHALVVGSWPADPGLAERCNLEDLPVLAGAELGGVLPEGAASLAPQAFRLLAADSRAPALGGRWHPGATWLRATAPPCGTRTPPPSSRSRSSRSSPRRGRDSDSPTAVSWSTGCRRGGRRSTATGTRCWTPPSTSRWTGSRT